MSLTDIFSGILGAASAGDPKGAIDAAIYGLQNEVGKFLSSGQTLLDIKTEAQPYVSANTSAASAAQAVITKADSLLANLQLLQSQAMTSLSQASALRNQMDTDPVWINILQSDWNSLGYETLLKAKQMVGQASTVASDLTSLASKMENHLNQVAALQSDSDNLNNIAQGKGIAGIEQGLTSALSGVGSTAKNTVYIVAAIAAGVFLLPYFMSGAARGARGAYKSLRENPRRRRAYRYAR